MSAFRQVLRPAQDRLRAAGLESDFLSNRLWETLQNLFVAQQNRPNIGKLFLDPGKSFRADPIHFRHLGEK
jgi:hypothetical protein